MRKPTHNNTTITLSIPYETKEFLDQLAMEGYNRSNLMLKLISIVHTLYFNYPQVPLPRGIERLNEMVGEDLLSIEFEEGRLNPKPAKQD